MAAWTAAELRQIGAANELRVASLRLDGTLRNPVTIWVVRSGDDIYVRSVRGSAGKWYRGVQDQHKGRIEAGGVEKDVSFVGADDPIDDAIDAAYRDKYGHSPAAVEHITSDDARSTTLKLVPRG